jgi:hypothetical protein
MAGRGKGFLMNIKNSRRGKTSSSIEQLMSDGSGRLLVSAAIDQSSREPVILVTFSEVDNSI